MNPSTIARAAADDFQARINGRQFATLLADPPWQFQNRTGKVAPEHRRLSRYSTMTLEDIKALPVADAAQDTAHLYLWVPNALLPEGLAVMAAWGFTYITGGSWTKRTPTGKAAFGGGYVLRSSTEPFLVGRLGAPQITSRSERNLLEAAVIPDGIESLRREHSRKPPEMRAMIERLLPRAHCAELFAREPWPGHEVWGNQVEKFEGQIGGVG